MLTLLFLPLTWQVLVLGFLLFRVFDILKPFPVGALERLPGGAGIMADDLAAGIYGNLLLQAAVRFAPGLMGTA
jgi:phosphatidylglycerophosphatase A